MPSVGDTGSIVRGRGLQWCVIAFGLVMIAVGVALSVRGPRAPSSLRPVEHFDASPEPWFEEVASRCGIDFRHESGSGGPRYLPEIVTGGVALLDYDRDGFIDVYFVQGGRVTGATAQTPGNRLFRNQGNGTFVDVTRRAAVGDTGYGISCLSPAEGYAARTARAVSASGSSGGQRPRAIRAGRDRAS